MTSPKPLRKPTHARKLTHMTTLVRLIGSADAAKILGITRSTFNRRVTAGKIPVAFAPDGETGARLFDADLIALLGAEQREQSA